MSALTVHAEVAERDVRVDLAVPAGSVAALLGANGSGKSTVVGLAAGILRPSAGAVTLSGRTVSGRPWVPPHRRRISLLAQEPLLLPHLDVLANVAFGPRALGRGRERSEEIARARLEEVGAAHLSGRRPRELSGGQQQRVALARALAPDPELLLLDEPLAALDVDAAAELRQVLRSSLRAAGRSALVVTHDLLDVLALADHVVVLEGGRVVEEGPTREVLVRPRSAFAARFAGVNLVLGTRTAHDEVREGAGGAVLHGVTDDHAGGAPVGGAGTSTRTTAAAVALGSDEGATGASDGGAGAATFSPRAVAVHRASPGGSPRNSLRVRVTGIEQHGELVRVRALTPDGTRLAADITPFSVAELGLDLDEEVLFVVKAAEVSIYPA
ncbi:MAG: sulfate/molybdate ABC transporter ATP-binding protein [Actinomycetaceae bacterium]